jgi:hypothetical protein
MTTLPKKFFDNTTNTDIQLASIYYKILIDLAKHKHCLTNSELVGRAKHENPNHPAIQNAIPVSTGRRLSVVRMFTTSHNLLDLTCLVISKNLGECGVGFTDHFDPVLAREKAFAFDWSTVNEDFDGFVKNAETSIIPRKKVKELQARELMSEYYKINKLSLPSSVRDHRELIVELIMAGFTPAEAFEQSMQK